jgi:hypothetical protein
MAPLAGYPMVGLSFSAPQGRPLYVALVHRDALGWMRAVLSEHRHLYGGRGSQEFRPRVHYQRSGLPDFGVCTQSDLKAVEYGQVRRVVETAFFGYRGVLGALKSRGTCG